MTCKRKAKKMPRKQRQIDRRHSPVSQFRSHTFRSLGFVFPSAPFLPLDAVSAVAINGASASSLSVLPQPQWQFEPFPPDEIFHFTFTYAEWRPFKPPLRGKENLQFLGYQKHSMCFHFFLFHLTYTTLSNSDLSQCGTAFP
jgi:hypothetical protein